MSIQPFLKRFLLALAAIACTFAAGAEGFEASVGLSQTFTADPLYSIQFQDLRITIANQGHPLSFLADVSALSDGRYANAFSAAFLSGFYLLMRSGGLEYSAAPIRLRVGRLTHSDVVRSPYSLFISSNPNPAVLAEIGMDGGLFFYTTRWLMLNHRSTLYLWDDNDVPRSFDRGAVFKTYGIRLGDFRFGYQDSSVFTQESFDAEYFLNPVPGFLVQYVNTLDGNPWQRTGDANSIMGLFADYSRLFDGGSSVDALYAYAQLLIDDINGNRFLHPESSQNPDKIAWSLGGRVDTDYGAFGFYHAGATKFTFEAVGGIGTDSRYGYTYYPAVSYPTANGDRTIVLEENYIGYIHGENNISFLADWADSIVGMDLAASLEFTLSGSKSPANPWHQYTTWNEGGEGTKLLDDPVLEKRLVSAATVGYQLGDFSFSLGLRLGYAWNALALHPVPAELQNEVNIIEYFVPSSSNQAIASATLGVRYTWRPR